MLQIALAVLPYIRAGLELIPVAIEAGKDVAPLIAAAAKALDALGADDDVRSTEEFQAVQATRLKYETDFQDAVAAHLAAVGASE